MKNERDSGFELLRLFCIFGITVMHAFAGIDTSSSLPNTEVHILYNSLFNTGVSCFILISGYFGIRFHLAKLIRLDMMIIFFTLLSTIVLGDFGIKELIKSCLPVVTRQYWFITCYFALCILSPFLNQISEKLKRTQFRNLLLVLLLVFSFIPTLTTYDIMQDAGKGLADFVMLYLLGRYIVRYKNEVHEKQRLLPGFIACILTIFALDSILTGLNGVLYSTFARDCSIFIILASVLLVLLFKEIHFKSRIINRVAGNVLAVTVLDAFLQKLFSRYIDLNIYSDSGWLFLVVPCYALLIMLLAILLNEVRRFTIGRVDVWVSEFLSKLWYRVQELLMKLMQRVLSIFLKPV